MYNISTHTFYFVRYPLGAGGTHLSNLISLSPTIQPRLSDDRYFEALCKEYTKNKTTVHLLNHYIISDPKWKTDLNKIDYNYAGSVWPGHAASFVWAKDTLDTLPNKKYVLLTFNTSASRNIIKQREQKLFSTNTLDNRYYTEELRCFYNAWFNSNDDDNLVIETEDLFLKDISEVLNKLNQKYNLCIPFAEAQELHTLWLSRITSIAGLV